jgi:ribosome biogenesis protein ENP2
MPEPTPSSSTNYTRIYTVNGPSTTSSSTLPTWITTKTKHKPSQSKKRQRTQHSLGQLELIQDFAFHQSAIKIKLTPDGQHAVGTGTYKPMMKVWDLNQLTVKFERVTDAENVDFVMLSQDWTKSLHLQADRSLQLHTQGGLHHTIRLPTYGRTLNYYSPTCEALVGATGKEVFRFDLDQGRYLSPIQVGGAASSSSSSKTKWKSADEIDGVNCLDVNKTHGLWSFGLDGASSGHVEFWDPRSRSTLTSLNLPTSSLKPSSPNNPASPFMSVTALESHPSDGLSLAVGTSTGHTLLYDLRSPRPFAVKDQGYAEPIKKVNWLIGSDGRTGKIASSDSKVIKVWEKDDHLDNLFSLQPHAPLLDLCPLPGSGILLAALDSPQMSAYYIPELGPAPRWASFLDGVTEELEDDVTGVQAGAKGAYRDYKFIDRSELETLGLSHLIGTPTLKPYMHGYFLSLKLYSTARLIANPQSYEEHRERVLEDKVAKQQESRIRARKVQPKVNKALAERVRKQEEREEAKEKRRREKKGIVLDDPAELDDDEQDEGRQEDERPGGKKATNILQDPRFKELWENPDFEVDEGSREYELLNPGSVHAAVSRPSRSRTFR